MKTIVCFLHFQRLPARKWFIFYSLLLGNAKVQSILRPPKEKNQSTNQPTPVSKYNTSSKLFNVPRGNALLHSEIVLKSVE